MGLKERHARERQEVSRAILDAARDLFVSEGYARVSMRKVAERIEYSPAAIYRYFSSKDDIFFALAEEGFRLLDEGASPRVDEPDPLEAVRETFLAFYRFSGQHPEYFALMFLDRSVPSIRQYWERFAFIRETRGRVVGRLRECSARGLLPADLNPEAAFSALTAGIHGVAVMRVCDRPALGDRADALARDVIETTLAGLRAGTTLTYEGRHPGGPAAPPRSRYGGTRSSAASSRSSSGRTSTSSRGSS